MPIILLLICLATLAVYLPAIPGTWLWDDDLYLAGNEEVKSPAGLFHIWFSPSVTPNYYPMVFTSFWLEYRLWGDHPQGYHLTNVLLHCANCLLLYWILIRLRIPGGMFTAGLFALHPVHAESVAWIAERKDVLSSLFFLGAVLVWVKAKEAAPSRLRVLQQASGDLLHKWGLRSETMVLLLFAAAMLSKTVTCTLPVVLLLLAWYRGPVNWREDFRRLLPLFIVGLGLGLLSAWWESARLGADEAAAHLTLSERCLAAGRIPWFYLSKILWPLDLMPIYPLWNLNPTDLTQWLFPVVTGAVSLVLFTVRNSWGRPFFTAWFYFLIVLAPALGFIDFSTMDLSLVADHYQYLASIAPLVLVGAFLSHPRLPRGLALSLTVLLLGALGCLTWRHAADYRSPEVYWRHAMAGNPMCWVVHNNLGVALVDQGEYDEAIACYEEAARLRPGFGEPLVNIGNVLLARGRTPEAIAAYTRAMQADPKCANAPYRLGRLYDQMGEASQAEDFLILALKIKPRFAEALNSLGVLMAQRGELRGAIQSFERVLEIRPLHAKAARNLAQARADLAQTKPVVQSGTKEENEGNSNP